MNLSKKYPIPAKVVKPGSAQPIEIPILRLTTIGFQTEISHLHFAVGEIYQVEFTIPVFNKTMSEKVRVIRTADQLVGSSVSGKSYFVEMHFVNIDHNSMRKIREFEHLG